MNRRRAAAVAGAVTATAVAAALAIGVNFGLFGLASNADRVGTIRPIDVPGAPAIAQPAAADPDAAAPSRTPVTVVNPSDATGTDQAPRVETHDSNRDGSRHGATEVEPDD